MSALREWCARLGAFALRRGRDAEVDEEVTFHLDMMVEELRRRGMSAEEARREARRRFGGPTQVAESWADQRSLPRLETLLQDVKYATRTLARTPGFTLAALLTLAIGIGANAAIFSIVQHVLLRPLPYADPDRLVILGDRSPGGAVENIGFATLKDFRERNGSLESVVAIRSWTPTLVAGGEAERIAGMRVSWNYFSMLGVRPALGRDFRADEDTPESWQVVLISDGLWRRRFNADHSVVGRTLRMNDLDFRVIGVMPAGFEPLVSGRFYKPAQMWAPLGYDTSLPYACRSCQHLKALGRLNAGVTVAQAVADLDAIRRQLAVTYPSDYPAGQVAAVPLADIIAGPVRPALWVLLGAVAFVLLIACANVANLLLARAMNRSREMAVRAALGAGRGRLIRLMLTESALLSLAGAALGVAIAAVLLDSLTTMAPVSIPRLDRVTIDGPVLLFTLALAGATGVLFGMIPALRASSFSLRASLASDSRASVGAGSNRARQLLMVGDIALAMVLLVGAGLMLRTVGGLMRVDPGFDPRGVLTLQLSLVGEAYREDAAVRAFQDRLLEKLRALPGVEGAALAGQIPMGGNGDSWGFHIEGRSQANPAEDPSVERYSVTPDYFRVMRIGLRRGRLFTAQDSSTALPVLVLSETTATKLWPGQDPLGARVRIGGATDTPWRTVVGIVGDVHHRDLAAPADLQMYLPQAQFTDSFLVATLRTSKAEPEALVAAARAAISDLDASVPVYDVAALDDLVERSFADRRFTTELLGAFAMVALLLAAVGLYGVVSVMVAQRSREVGVRVALGARPADILRLVFGAGLRTVGAGIGIGLLAAALLTRALESMLFQVATLDGISVAGAVATLAAVAMLAHYFPARRALRVDPACALRQD